MTRLNDNTRRKLSALFAIIISTFVFSAAARAQTVIPRVCVDAPYRTGTATLAAATAAGATTIQVNGYVPPFVALVINPGGANQETVPYVNINITGSNPYTLKLSTNFNNAKNDSFQNYHRLANAHTAGEKITFAGYNGTAYWGYNNTGNVARDIPRGILSENYFFPGPTTYPGQPIQFAPGIHDNVFTIPFGGQASDTVSWELDNNLATARSGGAAQCATITYQGRLTTSGAQASGNYDFRFTLYDALTGGTAQSDVVFAPNVAVSNGVFTVNLNFFSSLIGNNNARYIEIGVRSASQNANDPYTTLAPRQPVTPTPFAVNAQKAFDVQLVLTSDMPSDVCNATAYGQMRFDASANTLWICGSAGWKSTVLQ